MDNETRRILKFIFLVLAIVGSVWFVVQVQWVLNLLVVSLLIVYVLTPIVQYLKKRQKFPHGLAVALVFIFFLLMIVILISLFVPIVEAELRSIIDEIPKHIVQFQRYLQEATDFIAAFEMIDVDVEEEVIRSLTQLPQNLEPILEEVASISFVVLSSMVNVFFILFIVFYLLYDFESVRETLIKLVPSRFQAEALDIMHMIDHNFGSYIRGNIVRCSLVGLITGIILYALGMPYALLLGVLAGVLNIILYIGPYIAAFPALLISFSPATPPPLGIIILYVAVQILDGTVIAPIFLGRAVKLKPITVIVALLIGAQLAGFLGMILAIPVAGTMKNIYYYFQKKPRQGHTS